MNNYKTPDSNLDVEQTRTCKPIKAVVYGLLVSVGVLMTASNIEAIVFLLLNREAISSLGSENEIKNFLASSNIFLTMDLLISMAILYWAGTIIRKQAYNKEIKYGLIVSCITSAVMLAIYFIDNAYEIYPIWYSTLAFLSVFVVIFYGAKPRK
jgi:hypothetical protein